MRLDVTAPSTFSNDDFHPGKRTPIPANVPPSRQMYRPSRQTYLYPGKRTSIPAGVLAVFASLLSWTGELISNLANLQNL